MRNADQQLLDAIRGIPLELARGAIAAGADVNSRDQGDNTPLHWAVTEGRLAIAHLLIASGADIDARNEHQRTPLHWAVNAGRTDIARLLIEAGADLSARDDIQQTPLDRAIDLKATDMVALLQAAAQKSAGHVDRVNQDRENEKDTGSRRPMRG